MKLGVDVYSLRSQPWDAFGQLEYAHQIGVDLVHFSETRFLDSVEDEYLKRLKRRADELGLAIEVGMFSICPTSTAFRHADGPAVEQLRRMLHVADMLGSRTLRAVQGTRADRMTELPFSAHMEATVKTCQAVRSQALDLGIKIAIENHAGDMQGRELKALIEAAGTDFVGACIDTGNAMWTAESPFVTLQHLAPYVVTSHIRDTAVWLHPKGAAVQWVAMGDGAVHIDQWAKLFKEQCPNSSFTLEIITGGTPTVLNYLEPEFWKVFPDTPAAEFVEFLKLAQEGQPYMGAMVTTPRGETIPEFEAALVAQQRRDVERSVRYCQEVLGVGERGKA
jgi:sugar phosphate isomerase/epimerase